MIFLTVVALLIALAFPFNGAYITELMPRGNLPATVSNRLCRQLEFRGLGWSAKTKGLEQIEAVLFILMSAPVQLAYLPAPAFS